MSNSLGDSALNVKESIFNKARLRWRCERLISAFGLFLSSASLLLALIVLLSVLYSKLALLFPLLATVMLGSLLLIALAVWIFPIRDRQLWTRLDRAGKFHDGILTMQELSSRSPQPVGATDIATTQGSWASTQRAKVLAQLNWERIQKGWPLLIPRTTQYAAMLCTLLLGIFACGFYSYQPSQEELASQALMQDAAKAIDQTVKDWEKVQKEQPTEELKKSLEELKPLQERLAKGDMSEKELLQSLSSVQEKLIAMQQEAKEKAMDPALAKELAEALEPMPGTSGLAAALKQNDMENAERRAEELAKQWEKPDAKAPNTPLSEEAKEKLATAAKHAESAKMESIAEGLKQLSASQESQVNSNNPANPNNKQSNASKADGMSQLAAGLAKAGECKKTQIKLALQLLQISQCKSCGSCNKPGMCVSLFTKICQNQKPGGKSAGSSTTGNPLGASTAMDAEHKLETLQGSLGEGESEVTTESTSTPTPAGALAPKTAQFRSYEKLSKVAIDDENLPLAHREAIKRYFENIRPRDQ